MRTIGCVRLLLALLVLIQPEIITAQETQHGATSIDQILSTVATSSNMKQAELCNDEQFLRRITLDLLGRVPTLAERESFLAAPGRRRLIDNLVETDEFVATWADLWATQLYGYVDANDTDRAGLVLWLESQLRERTPADDIAYHLIAASGESAFDGAVNFLLRYSDEPIVKVSRAFLGVRLDCARCHDHPFDRWTQEDFERMNRFFEPVVREEVSRGNVRLRDIIPETATESGPRFLTGAEPRTTQWRQEFALFTVRSRPFARNFCNRLWYHFMGRGIIHPVDDVSRDNPASIPALLEWLTDEAIRNKFDVRHMIRLICSSNAYQRISTAGAADEQRKKMFLVRIIKPLPAEHWYAAMCTALDRAQSAEERLQFIQDFHGEVEGVDFSATWDYRETMQGFMSRLLDRVNPPTQSRDELFLRFLGRSPTAEEIEFFKTTSAREISYILLHSSEFAFNH